MLDILCVIEWTVGFVISQKITLPHALYFNSVVLDGFSSQKLFRLVSGAEREVKRTLERFGPESHGGGFRDDVVAERRGELQEFVHGGRPRETAAINRPLDDVLEQAAIGGGRGDFRFAPDFGVRFVDFHDAVVGGPLDGGRDHGRVPGDGLQHFERQEHADRHPAVVEPDLGLEELVIRQIGVVEIELELLDDSRIPFRGSGASLSPDSGDVLERRCHCCSDYTAATCFDGEILVCGLQTKNTILAIE